MKKLFTVIGLLFSATAFAQNVGIGETNPTAGKLQVKAADSAVLLIQNTATPNGTKTGLFFKSDANYSGNISTIKTASQTYRMGLFTFGGSAASSLQERVSILDDGNVGIGTTTPNYLLDINGRARLRHNGNTSGIWYNKADNTDGSFVGMNNDTTFGFYGSNGWSSVFDIKNSRLGIGTLTPTAPLSFPGTLGNKIALWGNAAGGHYGLGIQGNLLQIYSQGTSDDIVLGYGNSTAFTENMRVKGNGNVGIGTNNPTASIEVARGTGVGGTAQFNGTTYTSHINYSTTEDTYLRGGKTSSKVFINDQANGNVLLAGGGGNVGIGSPNPSAKLEVAGTIKFADGTEGLGKVLTSDANGNATWQAQAYGNTERFEFKLSSLYSFPVTFTTVYNYGTATPNYLGPEQFEININKSGLYHFDIQASQDAIGDFSVTSATPKQLYVNYYSTNGSSNQVFTPFLKYSAASSVATYTQSFEVYILAGSAFGAYSFKLIPSNSYALKIRGHLISE